MIERIQNSNNKRTRLIKVQCLFFIFFGLLFHSPLSFADNDSIFLEKEFPKITQLNWLNQNFLDKQRNYVDALTRSKFGTQIKGRLSDLRLIQRIIDNNLIDINDKEALQALGVIVGDIYANENKTLNWVVYEDELGKSHAVCLQKTNYCVFPITMLSRRIEAGLKPSAERVYNKGLMALKPHFPKRPFMN